MTWIFQYEVIIQNYIYKIVLEWGHKQELHKRRPSKRPEKTSDIIKKVIDETEVSSSLYPTVKEINKDFSIDQKKEMLQNLWELVAADGVINHYEENLFFKIADLIKIKRSQANQIKQRNS